MNVPNPNDLELMTALFNKTFPSDADCLQLYLCGFWIYRERKSSADGAVLEVCRKSARITDAQVRAYVSPDVVNVA